MPVNNFEINTPDWDYTCTRDAGPETSGAEALSVEDGVGICAEREG